MIKNDNHPLCHFVIFQQVVVPTATIH
ncbi:unnamed protein product, partial [Onchocerca ochengi]|uniref:Uncharacterized protein n=1 Tax=Onchocerca ochengi TaxID=42157 RepID=A0A182EZ43_ONCOC